MRRIPKRIGNCRAVQLDPQRQAEHCDSPLRRAVAAAINGTQARLPDISRSSKAGISFRRVAYAAAQPGRDGRWQSGVGRMTQEEIELAELDIEIAHLEALLELRNERRRELVNYLGLNKERTSERRAS